MVERVLAKDEAGVRFSLSAQLGSEMEIPPRGGISISERAIADQHATNAYP